MRIEYQTRRNLTFNLLNKIEGVSCYKPEGAFYILAKLPIDDSEEFAKWLLTDFHLNKETIMVAPVTDFYQTKGLGKNQLIFLKKHKSSSEKKMK